MNSPHLQFFPTSYSTFWLAPALHVHVVLSLLEYLFDCLCLSRGVLLNFKREFSMEDLYSLWEVRRRVGDVHSIHKVGLMMFFTVKAGLQYDTMRAMRGVKHARVRRNRLGFYSCVSCVHVLRRIVNQA